MNVSLFGQTPAITVLDNRGLYARNITYHRHPDTPEETDERIMRHQYNTGGFLTQSSDPRLYGFGQANFIYRNDLSGHVLRAQSADAGISVTLNDIAGRIRMAGSSIRVDDKGREDISQAVFRTRQYEGNTLPGRPLSVTEITADGISRVSERFVYAKNSQAEKDVNLAGECTHHYDQAGLLQTNSMSVSNVALSVSRRLLKDADNPATAADWQGDTITAWNVRLDEVRHTTLSTVDATTSVLTTLDAAGNRQRVAYDIAGMLKESWLTLKNAEEQVIVKSLTYSAAGQKLREEHGNGVVTTYFYEATTQRLTGMKTERPAGHAAGAKVLQDLRYAYDPVGNVTTVSNDAEETRFWRNQRVKPENAYTYDSLYQLVKATGREMANAGQQSSHFSSSPLALPADNSAYTLYTRTYTYDTAGNLTEIRHSAPATNTYYTTSITVSNRSNRGVLSTLTNNPEEVEAWFTAAGYQMQLQPGQDLTWTPQGELLTVTTVLRDAGDNDGENYRYDSMSQRILKVSKRKTGDTQQTQHVTYLPGLEQRLSLTGSTGTESRHTIIVGEAGRAQVRILHWESGLPAGMTNDQVRYSIDNLTGSSGLELDGQGEIISLEEYYPYGGTALWAARSQIEAEYKTVRYSGKERDATGLYYYGYRYYQPWAGRWLSADPAGPVDGLNLFRMNRNNPVTFYDSDGKKPVAGNDDYKIIVDTDVKELFRADGRSPEEIVKAGGFSNAVSIHDAGTLGQYHNGEAAEPIIYTAETALGMKDFANQMPGEKYFYQIDAVNLRVASYEKNFATLTARKNLVQHLKQQKSLMDKILNEGWETMDEKTLRDKISDVSNPESWRSLTTGVNEAHVIGEPEQLLTAAQLSQGENSPIIPLDRITVIGKRSEGIWSDKGKHIKLASMQAGSEPAANLSPKSRRRVLSHAD